MIEVSLGYTRKSHISEGNRLILPDFCPAELESLVLSTWSLDPNNRPCFATIIKQLTLVLESADLSHVLNTEFYEIVSARTASIQTDSGFEKTPLLYPY